MTRRVVSRLLTASLGLSLASLAPQAARAQTIEVVFDTLAPAPAAGRAAFPLASAPIGPFRPGQSAATRTPTVIPMGASERRRLERLAATREAQAKRAGQPAEASRLRRLALPIGAAVLGATTVWLGMR